MGSTGSTLRIGVTGHRNLPAVPEFRDVVKKALEELIAKSSPDGTSDTTVVSALAEGADRLVAEIVLHHPGAALEAILPLEPDDYESDFAEAVSREVFRTLLDSARSVEVVAPTESRKAAYQGAGHAMLERIDLLIALWDGQPARGQGGTAEIVQRAIERGVPVVWISTVPPYLVRRLDRDTREAARS